ncbi:hypothetical protein, partial [Moorena sp. SIO4A5]|uniref:hypothetical protein n=1 Tax=Moorena sp. SIO4A5 TaxID=2607838 RepID=UPI0025E0DF6A
DLPRFPVLCGFHHPSSTSSSIGEGQTSSVLMGCVVLTPIPNFILGLGQSFCHGWVEQNFSLSHIIAANSYSLCNKAYKFCIWVIKILLAEKGKRQKAKGKRVNKSIILFYNKKRLPRFTSQRQTL